MAGDPGPWRLPSFAAPAVGQPGSAAGGWASRGGRGTQGLQRQEGRSVPEQGCWRQPARLPRMLPPLGTSGGRAMQPGEPGLPGKAAGDEQRSQAATVKGQPRALPRGGGTVCGSCWASRLAGAWPFPAPVRAAAASPWVAILPSPSRSSCTSPALPWSRSFRAPQLNEPIYGYRPEGAQRGDGQTQGTCHPTFTALII